MQWEHIVEQSSGGPNSVGNLALTSATMNQQLNTFFGAKYYQGEIRGMPGTGGQSLRAFLKGQAFSEHRTWKLKAYSIFGVSLHLQSNERGRYQTLQ